jgi:DNA polymerase III delta subunit
VINDPYPLIRAKDSRNALIAVLQGVAPGNGIVFLDPMDRVPSKGVDAARQEFATAIRAAGGEAAALAAPSAQAFVPWIEARAGERGIVLDRAAAAELARRLGGLVRDGDIDRRRQGQLAVAELDKLALLHLDGSAIRVDDVQALVAEAIPGSAFAFLDALGARRVRESTELLERLWETTPEPVVVVQMYNRIRQLVEVTDRIAQGEAPRQLSTSMKLHPYVLEKLVRQSHACDVDELVAALDGLLELDVLVKSATGVGSSEQSRRLAFVLWVDRHVGRDPPA